MGYIRHHAIVVTSWDKKLVEKARRKAMRIFNVKSPYGNIPKLVSTIITSPVNGYYSIFIAPDGSKEGWEESDNGDVNRDNFINWINEQAYEEDNSNSLSYAELFYGDDEGKSKIVKHN